MPDPPHSSRRELEVFVEVVEIDDPEERAARLAELCGEDAELRERVEHLIRLDIGGTAFMDKVELSGEVAPPGERVLPDVVTASREGLPPEESYRIGPEIARGGMGQIRRGKDLKLDRTVALKVLHEAAARDPLLEARFLFEAKILARLEHPNIVPIHDIVWDEGRPLFYSMKLVNGSTLQSIIDDLRDEKPEALAEYPLAELLSIFEKVCGAMSFAHSRGIIHRDLKPDNIMVGEFGEVLVMDWGIAKQLGGPDDVASSAPLAADADFCVTLEGDVMGTPQYMNPEQAEGRIDELDARSDIYSLGAILYAILTLRPPVEGETLAEVLGKVSAGNISIPAAAPMTGSSRDARMERGRESPPSRPLPHVPGGRIPSALSAVAMKALRREKEQRYQAVRELQEEVEAYQRGFATSAEQASPGRQLFLLIQRHRQAALVAAGAFFVIIFITVLSILQIRDEKDAALLALADSKRTVAEFALGEDDIGRMIRTLQSTPESHRDQEWDYLMAKADTSVLAVPPEPGNPFTHITSHPGLPGVFAVALRKGEVRFLSALTGEEIDQVDSGFPRLNALSLSPDGKLLAVAAGTSIRFIRLSDHSIAHQWEIDWPGGKDIDRIDFSPDSRRLVVESRLFEKQAVAYSYPEKLELETIPNAMGHVYLGSSSNLAGITIQGIIVRYPESFNTGRPEFRQWTVVPLGNDESFLSADVRGRVEHWSVPKSAPDWDLESGLEHPGMFPSGDGRYLVVFGQSDPGAIMGKIFSMAHRKDFFPFFGAGISARGGDEISIDLQSVRMPHGSMAFCGTTNVFACLKSELKFWRLPLLNHGAVDTFMPCSEEFAFVGEDQIFVRLFHEAGSDQETSQEEDHSRNAVQLFSLPAGKRSGEARPRGGKGFYAVAASRSGTRAVVGTNVLDRGNFGIRLIDLEEGDFEGRLIALPDSLLRLNRGLEISEDGSTVLAVTRSGRFFLYDFDSGELIQDRQHSKSERILEAKFVPDSTEIVFSTHPATTSEAGVSRIFRWDFKQGTLRGRDFDHPIDNFAISPDGKKIAVTRRPSRISLVSRETLEDYRQFRAHDGVISALSFHPDGKTLASASVDGSVKIWDLSDYRLKREWHDASPVFLLRYSPEGSRLAWYADPRKINVVDLAAEADTPIPDGVSQMLEWKRNRATSR